MVSLPGVRCKEYLAQVVGAAFPPVSCPAPECRGALLRSRGWYQRLLGGKLERLRRGLCTRCRVSHALFPADLCAYRDATLDAVEAALEAGAPSAGAKASGQDDAQGVRRVRRWLHSESAAWATQMSALLPATGGTWWEQAQAVVGADAGWLTRLRSFLWSSYLCFLGGVHGLYRHGRPRLPWPSPAPHLGNCSKKTTCDKTP